MNLNDYLKTLDGPGRSAFAERCGTSFGHLRNIGYGLRTCNAALALRIERASARKVLRRDLRDDWADIWPDLARKAAAKAAA